VGGVIHIEYEVDLFVGGAAAHERQARDEIIKVHVSRLFDVELCEQPLYSGMNTNQKGSIIHKWQPRETTSISNTSQESGDWEVLEEGLLVDAPAVGAICKILPDLAKDEDLVNIDCTYEGAILMMTYSDQTCKM
jgi:hypothetical protein